MSVGIIRVGNHVCSIPLIFCPYYIIAMLIIRMFSGLSIRNRRSVSRIIVFVMLQYNYITGPYLRRETRINCKTLIMKERVKKC